MTTIKSRVEPSSGDVSAAMASVGPKVAEVTDEGWMLVGSDPERCLLVRGGRDPIAISASSHDRDHLIQLLEEANRGRLS